MKIFCIGRNFVEHAKELENDIPKKPLVFLKPPTALLKNNRPFYYPNFSDDIQHEVEVVLKICKNGKSIAPKFAHKYYNELTLGIDLTARDIQRELKANGHPWEIAKGFDHSAIIGSFLPKEMFSLTNLKFSLTKNDEIVQQGTTAQMIFDFNTIIAYISKYFMLQTGDLIYTGTPKGVGPITIGDTYKGFLEEKEVFNIHVK